MYFGVDTDQSGDWRKNKEHLADGYEDGIAYNNNTPPAWSPLRPNVRRYQQLMLKETGVDMALHSIWTLEQKYVFQRWCENTSARAELEFFKHIKSRYPSIKTFSWYYPPSYGYTFSNWALYGQYVDGFINDPYNSLNTTFHFYRQFKTLYPDKLLCIIIHGNFVKREVRTGRLTNAYLSGADIIGFFEGVIEPVFGTELVSDIDKTAYPFPENSKTEAMDWESETTWRLNCDLFAEIKNLPPFNMKAPFLLVSGNFDRSAQASIHHYSSLFFFDNLTAGSVFMVEDFSRYDMIVTHQCPFIDNKKFMNKYHVDGFGIDKEKILDYVAKGGILALFDRKLPEFLQEYIGENNFVTETIIHDKSEVFISTSKPFVKQHAEEFFRGILVKHGKGLIFYSGFVDGINSLDYRKVLSYERYTADVLRALLERGGKKELADKFINPAGHECNYRLIKDIHGSYFYRFFRKDSKPSAILVEGEDILRSGSNLGSIYMKRKVIK